MLVLPLLNLMDLHLPVELEIYFQLLHLFLILLLQCPVVVLELISELLEALGETLAYHLHVLLVLMPPLLEVTLNVQLLFVHIQDALVVYLPLLLHRHLTSLADLASGFFVLVLQVLHLLLMDLDVDLVVALKHFHLAVHVVQLCFNLLDLSLGDVVELVHHVLLQLHVVPKFGCLIEAVHEGIDAVTQSLNGQLLQVWWDHLLRLRRLVLLLLALLAHGCWPYARCPRGRPTRAWAATPPALFEPAA
mmetsp:Transcript_42954/g.102801  ORF Transcript_42954/g.102801 Transcript_42954/m.102801 type:complete len:248 (-) Transcript_42954:2-745(-)